jgi:hypothetical protein
VIESPYAKDSDGDSVVDAGEDLISVKGAMPSEATTNSNTDLTDDSNALAGVSFYFNSNGRSSIADGETGQIIICDSRLDLTKAKLINIYPIGRVETISGPASTDLETGVACS